MSQEKSGKCPFEFDEGAAEPEITSEQSAEVETEAAEAEVASSGGCPVQHEMQPPNANEHITHPVVEDEDPDRPRTNIGPGSILWDYAGDWRMGFTGVSAGILQLMHPGIGAAVWNQSDFFKNPWGRIMGSIPEIIGAVYDPDGIETGERIKSYHTQIKGHDEQGRKYHALDPETFWFAHGTFHGMVEGIIDNYDMRRLSANDREQLYEETTEWYSRYGVSMRPVPEDYGSFRDKMDDIYENVLEMTPAAQWSIDRLNDDGIGRMQEIPKAVWKLGSWPLNSMLRLTAIGGLPESVRDRFDIGWSRFDALRLKAFETQTQIGWPFLPNSVRYHSRARAGMEYQRAQGR